MAGLSFSDLAVHCWVSFHAMHVHHAMDTCWLKAIKRTRRSLYTGWCVLLVVCVFDHPSMGRLWCVLDGVHYRPVFSRWNYDNNFWIAGSPNMEKTLRRYVKPPCGNEVRRMIGMLTLAVGIPRLLFFTDVPFNPLRFADPWVYGILMTVLGVLLLTTSFGKRRTMYGKFVAGASFVAWSMLAVATTSATSLLVNLIVAASLLMEVYINGPCDQ